MWWVVAPGLYYKAQSNSDSGFRTLRTWDLGFGLRLDNVVFLSILHFEMCAIIPGLAG